MIGTDSKTLRKYIAGALISIIRSDSYQNITDFKWLSANLKTFILNCPFQCERELAETIQVL